MTSDTPAISMPTEKPRILFVDDDPLILDGFARTVYREFDGAVAEGPELGLTKIKNEGPYVVVISDMRMPVMDGAEFLAQVRALAPDTIRVMLTGYTDMEAATRAVNEGRIFRFLNKPVTASDLMLTLRACVSQYDLVRREKDFLENTLGGVVRVLSDVLNLANPVAFNKGARMCKYVRHITEHLGLPDPWQYEIAAMLSELGCLTLTPDLLEAVHAGDKLSPENERRFSEHPKIAHYLLSSIPRLEAVAAMILQQNDPPIDPSQSLTPDSESIRRGANMLKVCLAFDRLLSTGSAPHDALAVLRKTPAQYDLKMIEALADFKLSHAPTEVRTIDVHDLRSGMILNEDLRSTAAVLLAAKGSKISPTLIKALRNFIDDGTVKGKVMVTVTVAKGDIPPAKATARGAS